MAESVTALHGDLVGCDSFRTVIKLSRWSEVYGLAHGQLATPDNHLERVKKKKGMAPAVSDFETVVHVSHLSGIKKGKEILAELVSDPKVAAPHRARFMERDKIKKQP